MCIAAATHHEPRCAVHALIDGRFKGRRALTNHSSNPSSASSAECGIQPTCTITEAAKQARRLPPPAYSERVYDTASRCSPTPLERRMYAQLLARPQLTVRDAARIVAWYRCTA
jgi:hypothetical protein